MLTNKSSSSIIVSLLSTITMKMIFRSKFMKAWYSLKQENKEKEVLWQTYLLPFLIRETHFTHIQFRQWWCILLKSVLLRMPSEWNDLLTYTISISKCRERIRCTTLQNIFLKQFLNHHFKDDCFCKVVKKNIRKKLFHFLYW